MQSWVVFAAHVLLQAIHSVTGAALEGVRPSVTSSTSQTPPTSQHTPYWIPPDPPDPPTYSTGGGHGGVGESSARVPYTAGSLEATRSPAETQVPPRAPHTVFPQTLPQETPVSYTPRGHTQAPASADGQQQADAVNQVTQGTGEAAREVPWAATPHGSSSSRKTQVTSRPESPGGLPPPRPLASRPDHSPAIKASSGPPLIPTQPVRGTLPDWDNGRLGISGENVGQAAPSWSPALHPPSPFDTSQTERAQLARIWSAGEDDQWAGGGRRGGREQGPPWVWTKVRRSRRKQPGEEAVAPPPVSSPQGNALQRAGTATLAVHKKSDESRTRDSVVDGGAVKLHMNPPEAAVQQGGAGASGKYEALRPGGGRIDFEVTETGEFDGFSVTRTEEVDAPPPAHPQGKNQFLDTSGAQATGGGPMSVRREISRSGGAAASKRQRLLEPTVRPPEALQPPTQDAALATPPAPSIHSLPPATLYHEMETRSSSASPPTSEDIYSLELSQMKQEVRQEVKPPTPRVAAPAGDSRGLEDTTLPSLFSGELIPPLPDHWGRSWAGMDEPKGGSADGSMTRQTSSEMDSDLDIFPFHLPTQISDKGAVGGNWEAGGTEERDGPPSTPQVSPPHMSGEDEGVEAWKQRQHTDQNVTSTPGEARWPGGATLLAPLRPSNPQRHTQREGGANHGENAATQHTEATQPTIGRREGVGVPWPGAGERVEFVTAVPGGSWDVWGGPALWDSISPSSNHSIRGSPVYSVYWGDTGGPGSPAGWPEGVWVIRGGSLAAIMALVATISVQVARDGPIRRVSTVADAPQRALNGQHATLATNLATSLASAHVLLIFGIQATGRAWVCGVVGLLLHFLHLVSCFWLLALTTRLLGSLLQRPTIHTALYCASAWGASLGLVVVSFVVNPEGYETRRYCWMSVERGMLVSFIVPVCSLILVNAGLCLAAQKLLLDMREGVKHEVMAGHKRDLRGAVCLLPLEGVSWFLCVVALEDHQSLALDCAAAFVSAALGWLVLYFHGWSCRCYGLCWLRQRLHHHSSSSSSSSTSSTSSRRMDDLSLPLTGRYDHDLAHQPLLHPLPPPPPPPPSAQGTTVTVTPTTSSAVTPPPPSRPEEFPLQPIFPGHDRREVY